MKTHYKHKKMHDLVKNKGLFNIESLIVLLVKLPTRLKQVKHNKSKQFCTHDQTKAITFLT